MILYIKQLMNLKLLWKWHQNNSKRNNFKEIILDKNFYNYKNYYCVIKWIIA